jgi:hypothetical protein
MIMALNQENENGGVSSPTADREVVTGLVRVLRTDGLTNTDVISVCEEVITRLSPPEIHVYDFRDMYRNAKQEIRLEHCDCTRYDLSGHDGITIPTDVELDAFFESSDYEPVVFTRGIVTPGQIIAAVKEEFEIPLEAYRQEHGAELAEKIYAEKMAVLLLAGNGDHAMPQELCEFLNDRDIRVPQGSSYREGRKVWRKYRADQANKQADDRERDYVERIRTGAARKTMGKDLCKYLDLPEGSSFVEGRKALEQLEKAAVLTMENIRQKGLTPTRTTTSIITVTGGTLGTNPWRCKVVVAKEAEAVAQ